LRNDRNHWVRLGKIRMEAMQVLGDPCPKHIDTTGIDERQPILMFSSESKEPHKVMPEAIERWKFLISAETHRLHVYDSGGVHAGLFSRAPVLADIPLEKHDFVSHGSGRYSELNVSAELLQVANDYVVAHSGLTPVEKNFS